jgi:hypothetical protein
LWQPKSSLIPSLTVIYNFVSTLNFLSSQCCNVPFFVLHIRVAQKLTYIFLSDHQRFSIFLILGYQLFQSVNLVILFFGRLLKVLSYRIREIAQPNLTISLKRALLGYLYLVLLQVSKCFGRIQIFCARPKIYLHIVAVTNILCQTKRWFAFSKIVFCAGTKVFEEALNAVKVLGWLKNFGPAQNILGPVKGQGIN